MLKLKQNWHKQKLKKQHFPYIRIGRTDGIKKHHCIASFAFFSSISLSFRFFSFHPYFFLHWCVHSLEAAAKKDDPNINSERERKKSKLFHLHCTMQCRKHWWWWLMVVQLVVSAIARKTNGMLQKQMFALKVSSLQT